MTASSTAEYSIGAVVELTSLSAHTIRAWEKRYSVVTPKRTDGGTRKYSARDVRRLQLLKAGVSSGHRISKLAQMSDDEVAKLLGPGISLSERTSGESPVPLGEDEVLRTLLAASDRMDRVSLERELQVQLKVVGVEWFLRTLLPRLLCMVGEAWSRGELSMASEHMVAAVVKSILLRMLGQAVPNARAPIVLVTTPEEETHELGALFAAVSAALAGARVTNLGPNLPPEAVAVAVERTGAHVVALSAIYLAPGMQREYLQHLRRVLPDTVSIWLGGSQALEGIEGIDLLDLAQMDQEIRHRIDGWSDSPLESA